MPPRSWLYPLYKRWGYATWLAICGLVFIYTYDSLLYRAYQNPYPNWDKIAYIGAVALVSEEDGERWYESVKERIPRIAQGFGRGVLTKDSETLYRQMPFYTIKPLYVGLMLVLERLGVPVIHAPLFLSLASIAGLAMLLFMWRPFYTERGVWWLFMAAFATLQPHALIWLARLATPDALCLALFAAALHGWLVRRSFALWLLYGLLCIAARPDMLLLLALITAALALIPTQRPMSLRQAGMAIGAGAAAYALINGLAGNYGWCVLIEYTFFRKVGHPQLLACDFTPQDYLELLSEGMRRMAGHGLVHSMALVSLPALAGYALIFREQRQARLFFVLLLVGWLSLVLRFIAFPSWREPRYYYPNYWLIWISAAELIGAVAFTKIAVYRRACENPS